MVAEAIANGTWLLPAPRVKVDLRKKPRLWDAWVVPPFNAAPDAGGAGADGLLSPGANAQAHAGVGAKGDASEEKDEWDAIMVSLLSLFFLEKRGRRRRRVFFARTHRSLLGANAKSRRSRS
jgi:hypothetical protein